MAKLIKLNVPKESKVGWLDDFGKSRDYYVLLVRADESPLTFAQALSRIFRRDFVFLENHAPINDDPDKMFPVYESLISRIGDVRMMLMANKVEVSNEDQAVKFPLLGFSMFDEDLYLFNSQGSRLFPCSYAGFDFLLMLSCNKGFDVSDLLSELREVRVWKVGDLTPILELQEDKSAQFLKTLLVNLGIAQHEREQARLLRRMGPVIQIPEENYPFRFFCGGLFPDSPLLEREDV